MKRGKSPANAIPHSSVFFEVAVLGNTTNAPTVPANGPFTAGVSTFPLGANGISTATAEAPTRTSAGIYVLTIAHQLANIIPINIEITAAGGSPTTALYGIIASIVPATRLITIRVYTPAGTLTDLGTSDMAVLSLKGYDTTSPS